MEFTERSSGLAVPASGPPSYVDYGDFSELHDLEVALRCPCGGWLEFTGEALTLNPLIYVARCGGCEKFYRVQAEKVKKLFIEQVEAV